MSEESDEEFENYSDEKYAAISKSHEYISLMYERLHPESNAFPSCWKYVKKYEFFGRLWCKEHEQRITIFKLSLKAGKKWPIIARSLVADLDARLEAGRNEEVDMYINQMRETKDE